MKKILYSLIWILGIAVVAPHAVLAEQNEEIMNVDRAFSARSKEVGAQVAFSEYLADDVVTINGGAQPHIGKENALAAMGAYNPNVTLTWEPMAGGISGDLGYTWGRFVSEIKSDEGIRFVHGKYITVWKRQADGTWKAIIDGGNLNPDPNAPEDSQ